MGWPRPHDTKQDFYRGTTPHKSSIDPTEDKNVITIGYYTEKGTRTLLIHARDDGTWKEFNSRAGKKMSSEEKK